MNNADAIRILKDGVLNGKDDTPENNEAIELAISALEKQIPKKPLLKYFDDLGDTCAYCPNCHASQGELKPTTCHSIRMQKARKIYTEEGEENIGHCIVCGQTIDWRVND